MSQLLIRKIHGIRQMKSKAHMKPLSKALSNIHGLKSEFVDYGYILIPTTNSRAINALIENHDPDSILVGFSNGCWAIQQFLELGYKVKEVFLISPALNVNAEFPNCERVTVYYSSSDLPVRAGKSWRKITRVLPWRHRNPHGWGEMGRVGYKGKDSKVLSVDMGDAVGHCWYDFPEVVKVIAQDVASAATRTEEK